MSKPINVLVLESTLIVGGVENLLLNTFTRLDTNRFNPIICTLYECGPMGRRFLESGCRLEHSLIRKKYDPNALLRLMAVIRRERIDVVYLVTQPLTLFWGVLAAKIAGVPVICLIGNTLDITAHPKLQIYRVLLPMTDAIVAQATTQRNHLVRSQHLPERLIHVVHNGVDPRRFDRRIDRCGKLLSINIPADAVVVGMTGRMVRIKGVDVLVRAFCQLSELYPNLYLVITGAGPELNEFRQLSAVLDTKDRIRFLGMREDLDEITQLYDVAVLPSRSEAFPMVLLEYMAASRPIVATNVGSITDVIQDEVHGLLTEADNPAALGFAIARVLDDPEAALRRAAKARDLVLERFTIDETARATEALLVETVEKRHR